MSRHVSGQMMPLPEALITHGTLQLILPLPPVALGDILALVMRPHVIHQIAGHPEADAALGTHILGGQRKGGCDRRRNQGGQECSSGAWMTCQLIGERMVMVHLWGSRWSGGHQGKVRVAVGRHDLLLLLLLLLLT